MCVFLLAALFLVLSSSLIEAKNWKIKIGPRKCDLFDEQGAAIDRHTVSKQYKDTTRWDSHKKGRHVFLVFEVDEDCGPPFANLTPLGSGTSGKALYQLGNITTDQLDAGAILDGFKCVCPPDAKCDVQDQNHPKPWQIKYNQYLENGTGQFDHCDGWIIVKP
jgi:hypothetical protein